MKTYSKGYRQALNSWECMHSRCNNPKDKDFKNYGWRGINVCNDWYTFAKFIEDMGFPPDDPNTGERMFLERLDNEGGYTKNNCKWATRSEQNKNRRKPSESKGLLELTPTPEFEITFEGLVIRLTKGA